MFEHDNWQSLAEMTPKKYEYFLPNSHTSLDSRLDRSGERHVTNGVCLNMSEGELGEYWSAILIKISRLPRFGLESLQVQGGYMFFYI